MDLVTMSGEIVKLTERVTELEVLLTRYKYIAAAIAVAVPFGGWAIYKRYLLNRVSSYIQEFVKAQEPDLTRIFFDSYQDNMYKFTSLLALAGSRNYDEAIDLFAPIEGPTDVAKYPVPIQKTIARCLIEAKNNRESNRAIAWQVIQSIYNADSSIENIRTVIQEGLRIRKYDDLGPVIEKHRGVLEVDKKGAGLASTYLRKKGHIQEARNILRRFEDDHTDIDINTAIAALDRDLGKFADVKVRLFLLAKAVQEQQKITLPLGWSRLLNTYIANSIDLGQEDDPEVLRTVEFSLRYEISPVEMFTVCNWLNWYKKKTGKVKDEIAGRLRKLAEGYPQNHMTKMIDVKLALLAGEDDKAERSLKGEIDVLSGAKEYKDYSDLHFTACALGELYLEKGDATKAKDVLLRYVGRNFNGELEYLLAKAYCIIGDKQEAISWLSRATNLLPRWAEKAKNSPEFLQSGVVA